MLARVPNVTAIFPPCANLAIHFLASLLHRARPASTLSAAELNLPNLLHVHPNSTKTLLKNQ